ncbi:SRPBCC domain-containing protein [Streptomyces benahoarensis]|uniref:Carbon monoxide dehydrogenase subunit G n=1 Tax=Streptomyces benahoarensis TaxID=2595054 RepID=A0A553Z5F9_9ACTN|nr:SRPBCC domain-containing protein [Streptomyces benahoarensis]TSB36639.1 carbon monoxide dehydrogenase subunit G [Streptomyces benahoarensis]
MEHEMYVPFPVGTVRRALGDAARVARCVPGAQLDAGADAARPEGRLRLRIGGSTITYRGALTVATSGEAGVDVTVEARGTEARGAGTAALTLTVRLSPADGSGTTLSCIGTVRSEGRLAEAEAQTALTAGRRLLDRFAANLAAALEREPGAGSGGPDASGSAADGSDASGPDAPAPAGDRPHGGIFDTEVPPPSLGPETEDAPETDAGAGPDADGAARPGSADGEALPDYGPDPVVDGENYDGQTYDGQDFGDDEDEDEVPAEAAHARRTMIGRSAEEVDHAPPRGRYAPVPAPEPHAASATLRWAAPAAAVVLAGAVVVGRALRRRR